jgi:NAD(P)-dependent dehydrogenase (short-subunit alcohol dehydrogenase family)
MNSERWCLVTGAAKRIGRMIALTLADAGWNIIIHYNTSKTEGIELSQIINVKGRKTHLVQLDLMDTQAVSNFIPQLIEQNIHPLALVNNASLFEPDTFDQDGSQHKAINVTAVKLLSESFFKARPADSGVLPVIVNMLDADPSKPNFNSYNASRREADALTTKLAIEFAPDIRVNGVALGPIIPSPRESTKHFHELLLSTPLTRPIPPEAVATTVHFLVENSSITGAIVPVDDGMHLKVASPK